MQILVTDGSYKHTLGIVRNLGVHGYKPWVSAGRRGCLASFSRYCAGTIVLPEYDAPDFDRALLQALDHYRIDLLMPVGAKAFEHLVPLKPRIVPSCQMISVEPEQLTLCLSKPATYELAQSLGVPVPKTWRPRSRAELRELARDASVPYPRVIKGAKEMGSSLVVYVNDAAELEMKFFETCERHGFVEVADWPIVQEYVAGVGCGFFAVYDRGQCGPTFQHRRVREMPPTGGYSVAAESFWHEQLLTYGKRLLDHLKWHGVAMVEFKLKANGELVLMEINPKFWGSLDLALEAGVDFPLELVRIAQGKKVHFSAGTASGVLYHWPLYGELEYVVARPSSVGRVLAQCLDRRTRSNLWLKRDPLPVAAMAGGLPRRLLAAARASWRTRA